MDWITELEVRDWAAVVGTIVAALIGVVGVFLALGLERADRYRTRLDDTLADVIRELGERAVALQDYANERPPDTGTSGIRQAWSYSQRLHRPGGPPSDRLDAAVSIAELAARRSSDRRALAALTAMIEDLPVARGEMQLFLLDGTRQAITRWRVGKTGHRKFVEAVTEFALAARSDASEYRAKIEEGKRELDEKDTLARSARAAATKATREKI